MSERPRNDSTTAFKTAIMAMPVEGQNVSFFNLTRVVPSIAGRQNAREISLKSPPQRTLIVYLLSDSVCVMCM